MKLISASKACQLAKISKGALLNYMRHGDFPQSIENPKNYYIFFEKDVMNWIEFQKEKVMQKWDAKKYQEKNRTMQYIAEIEKQLMIDQLISHQ